MLPARFRLTQERDFGACYRKGARASDRLVSVARLARGAGTVRVGVSVSRKVGGSVVRNRVKRWIREAARELVASGQGPFDLVITARPAAAQAGFDAIRRSILKLVRDAGGRTGSGPTGEWRE